MAVAPEGFLARQPRGSLALFVDDLILIESRVVIFPDKKYIAENPDAVGVKGLKAELRI